MRQYGRSSIIGIVFAILSMTNAVLEFGFQKGLRGLTPLSLGIALCMFALSVKDSGKSKALVLALAFAGLLNFVAGCMQLFFGR